jgi:dihydrofolate reductase
MISVIVATDEQRAIGRDGRLLWHLPGDMQFFKQVTTGHTVIMGRKTFESLPCGALPNRRNMVLSTQPGWQAAGCSIYASLAKALAACANEDEVFIIGGASVYRQAMPAAGKLYLTLVHHIFAEADTFFPQFDEAEWEEISRRDCPADAKNPYSHTFLAYIRKNNGLAVPPVKK